MRCARCGMFGWWCTCPTDSDGQRRERQPEREPEPWQSGRRGRSSRRPRDCGHRGPWCRCDNAKTRDRVGRPPDKRKSDDAIINEQIARANPRRSTARKPARPLLGGSTADRRRRGETWW